LSKSVMTSGRVSAPSSVVASTVLTSGRNCRCLAKESMILAACAARPLVLQRQCQAVSSVAAEAGTEDLRQPLPAERSQQPTGSPSTEEEAQLVLRPVGCGAETGRVHGYHQRTLAGSGGSRTSDGPDARASRPAHGHQ
jgi:hypothetical protein